ncbi:hypothetical protein MKX01_001163, partial [Papaver californicum]
MIKIESDLANNEPRSTSLELYQQGMCMHKPFMGFREEDTLRLLECRPVLLSFKTQLYKVRTSVYYGEMDDFLLAKIFLCGIPLAEPYLRERLNDSYYLMGIADPTGILKPDQVCVLLENGQISGDVLVYKHPGLHFGHIHILTATYVKELENFVGNAKYAIFFPIIGPRSKMANSDLDGDMYWVCRNTQLLHSCTPSTPWTKTYFAENVSHLKPTDFLYEYELEHHLFERFLAARFSSSNPVGVAATCWLSLMDTRLTLDKSDADKIKEVEGKLLHLIDIYYDSLDVAKSGKKVSRLTIFLHLFTSASKLFLDLLCLSEQVEIPPKLRQHKTTHFMQNKSSGPSGLNNSPLSLRKDKSYHSKSVLGQIFDAVEYYEEFGAQQ